MCCSQRCHWRFISSRRASQSRQKILLLSCIVWSVIVWNCILPHSLPFLLHQFCCKTVRQTKRGGEKQRGACSFRKSPCDVTLGSSWGLLNSVTFERKSAPFCLHQDSHCPPDRRLSHILILELHVLFSSTDTEFCERVSARGSG